jgi:hypothetical protein
MSVCAAAVSPSLNCLACLQGIASQPPDCQAQGDRQSWRGQGPGSQCLRRFRYTACCSCVLSFAHSLLCESCVSLWFVRPKNVRLDAVDLHEAFRAAAGCCRHGRTWYFRSRHGQEPRFPCLRQGLHCSRVQQRRWVFSAWFQAAHSTVFQPIHEFAVPL